MIGSTLIEEGRNKLCGLLQRNLDIFSWKPVDITGIPMHIAEHRLNVLERCSPIGRNLKVYVDDLVIKSRTEDEIVKDIEETFKTIREINMKLNPKKYTFGVEEGMFLGYKVITKGLKVCPDKVDAVLIEKSLPFFKTLKKCTKKSDFHWTTEAKEAFEQMKQLIAELPMLTAPMEKEELIVYLAATKETILSRLEVAGRLQKWSIELGEYAIHYRPRVSIKGHILAYFIVKRPEEDSPDTLIEEEKEVPEPWILFTDGSSCTDGSGAGLILTNPEGREFTYALRIAKQMGVKKLQANVDSRLVANQVNETYVAKETDMVHYLEKLKALTGGFKAFTIKQIPRSENKKANALSKIASTSFAHLSKQVLVKELKEKSISEIEVLMVVEEEGDTWMTPIFKHLTEETLPANMKKARAIKRKSWRFAVINGILYKKSFLGPWPRCVGPLQANYVLREIHEGSCSMHAGTQSVVAKALQTGEIISNNRKQFRDDPFKDKTGWKKQELDRRTPRVLWAHRTMIKSSNGDTLFSLTYGTEAVIPAEIGMPMIIVVKVSMLNMVRSMIVITNFAVFLNLGYALELFAQHSQYGYNQEGYADFLEKDFILQKESGRNVELDDEDILPSENTSKHPIKEEKIDPDRLCFNVEVEEHSLGDLNELANYKAALSDPEFEKWLVAMNAEMKSMYDNKVWRLVVLPLNAKVVKSKWIYKKKTDMDGKVHIYKARLVAKGCTQTYGVDYEETFSSVADIRAIRILVAIAAFYDYEIWQIDVKTAFLNGFLEEEIYMEQPEGFIDPNHPRKVCKSQRSIYGLKQASRSWNKRFDEEIKKFGFYQNLDEPCVYQKASGSNVIFLILYVDDIILMGNHIPSLQEVKTYLGKYFSMKDLEEAVFILGIKIYRDRSRRLIGLSQNAYLDKILKRYRMDNSKRGSIPMQVDLHLSKSQCATTSVEMQRMQNVSYASAVRSIMYDVRCTRPDVAFAQNITSCFQQNSGEAHWTVVKNILKYLRNTKDTFLVYGGNPEAELRVNCYCDAGFETDRDDTKSQTVYVFVLNGGAVFIDKLGVVPSNDYPIKMNCDNSAAIIMAKESVELGKYLAMVFSGLAVLVMIADRRAFWVAIRFLMATLSLDCDAASFSLFMVMVSTSFERFSAMAANDSNTEGGYCFGGIE
ncbi:retrotransposon protein, putative, ty1-copia subclass [Tanacetum coccineum]